MNLDTLVKLKRFFTEFDCFVPKNYVELYLTQLLRLFPQSFFRNQQDLELHKSRLIA
jgi:hypothetical protein